MVFQNCLDLLQDLDRQTGQISGPRVAATTTRHCNHGDALDDEHAADVLTLGALHWERSIGIGHERTAILGRVSTYLLSRLGYAVVD
jgi:hypothetical protein